MSSLFPWPVTVSSSSATGTWFFWVEVHILIFMFWSYFAFLKGTTKFRDEDGSPRMFTGPVPTDHVHIYNLDTEAWTTTYMDQAGEALKKASFIEIWIWKSPELTTHISNSCMNMASISQFID